MIIGVISDTHGLLRPEALKALRGSDLILHAGDIGSESIIPALREIAPVVAIRGNVDEHEEWAQEFPPTTIAEADGRNFYLLHDVKKLDLKPEAAGLAGVIFGHSHKPEFHFDNHVLFMNPGSAGPRRFNLPITVGRITIEADKFVPKIIPIA